MSRARKTFFEREMDHLEKQCDKGLLTYREFCVEARALARDYPIAAEESEARARDTLEAVK